MGVGPEIVEVAPLRTNIDGKAELKCAEVTAEIRSVFNMGIIPKLFGSKDKNEQLPMEIPVGMNSVLLQGIGMH